MFVTAIHCTAKNVTIIRDTIAFTIAQLTSSLPLLCVNSILNSALPVCLFVFLQSYVVFKCSVTLIGSCSGWMIYHTECTERLCSLCVFVCGFLNRKGARMLYHTSHSGTVYPWREPLGGVPGGFCSRIPDHTHCTHAVWRHCDIACAAADTLPSRRSFNTLHTRTVYTTVGRPLINSVRTKRTPT